MLFGGTDIWLFSRLRIVIASLGACVFGIVRGSNTTRHWNLFGGLTFPLRLRHSGGGTLSTNFRRKIFSQIEGFSSNNSCVFCLNEGESALQSLLCCRNVNLVWRDMAKWIGFHGYKVLHFKESFLKWFFFCKQVKLRKGKEGVLWLAICWSNWLVRNGIVFRNDK